MITKLVTGLTRHIAYSSASSRQSLELGESKPQRSKAKPGSTDSRRRVRATSSMLPQLPELPEKRNVVYLDDPADDIDFVTLHNILYFIYISCVNFRFSSEQRTIPLPQGYPDEPDPFLLYRNADKFLLPKLKHHYYFYLENNLTPATVVDMLFHSECTHHPELKELYIEYILANWDQVKDTEGWERALCQDDDDVSPSVVRYRSRLLFEISKKLRGTQWLRSARYRHFHWADEKEILYALVFCVIVDVCKFCGEMWP